MLDISGREQLQEDAERDRLAELRDFSIAGTAPEQRFDAITRAACALFKTPIAFLSLIEEDRQWFKSVVGFDIAETPRSISFCTHTIMSDDVMIVPDASLDLRFAENPLVVGEPHVRFYAGAPLVTDHGARLGALCIVDTEPRQLSGEQQAALRDLAALAMNQIALRRNEASSIALAGLAQALGQPLIAVGPSGAIEFTNRPAVDFFGWSMEEIRAFGMSDLISDGRLGMDAAALISVFGEAKEGLVSRPLRRDAKKKDGSVVPVEISVSRWQSLQGAGIAVVLRGLAEKAATALGQLGARRAEAIDGSDVAVRRLVGGLMEEGRHVALFELSIDEFDALCETLGRHLGHALLQAVSHRLRHRFPDAAVIARARAGHFSIVVGGVDSDGDGRQIGESLLRSLDGGFDLGGGTIEISASVGFVWTPRHGTTVDELIANAALALNEACRARDSRVKAYDEDFRIRSCERDQIRQELLHALRNDEFRLFFQPQVALSDGRIQGVEALLRWQHPSRGLLQPKDFLLDIEDGGMSLPVGWWTLEAACAQLAAWRAEGLPRISMGVNLFASQFRSEKLAKTVTGLIETYGIEPGQLELEVTETIALLNDEVGLRSLRELRQLGVRIAFDDFGTGYASLSSLQQFPLTTLKLDRGFICNITTVPGDAVITRSMLSLANDLGLTAIAEGIETREQEALLRMFGCRSGQGYLYSKPLSSEGMGLLLASEGEFSAELEIPARCCLS